MPALSTAQNQKLKAEKKIKNKNGYAQKKRCRDRNHGVSPEGGKGSLWWKGFVEQVGFESGVKKSMIAMTVLKVLCDVCKTLVRMMNVKHCEAAVDPWTTTVIVITHSTSCYLVCCM